MCWTFLKKLYANNEVRVLIYGTFTTFTALLVMRANVLKVEVPELQLLDPLSLTISAVCFFAAMLAWFTGGLLVSVCMPPLIRDHTNIDYYLEKLQKTVSKAETWEEVEREKVEEWGKSDEVGKFITFVLSILFLCVTALYLGGIAFFCSSVQEFLAHLFLQAPDLLPLL
tara:strand:- start:739 stop:1248 length:510 start_codon:yes stop_codon:yes gene_type:complete